MKPFQVVTVLLIVFSFRLGRGAVVATVPFVIYDGVERYPF